MLSTDNDLTRLIDKLLQAHDLAFALNHAMLQHVIKMALLEAAYADPELRNKRCATSTRSQRTRTRSAAYSR